MAWSKFLPLKAEIEKIGVNTILGVIPDCKDQKLSLEPERDDFFEWVRKWASFGDTIAQHGTFHVYDTHNSGVLGINKRSEFAGHSLKQQTNRLAHGKEILKREKVWQPYFMAPAHSFDITTVRALANLSFIAVTDGYGFFPYYLEKIILVPQLTSFPINSGFGYCTICVHINTMSSGQIKKLLTFIKKNKDQFCHFEDVINQAPKKSKLHHNLSRSFTSHLLHGKRFLTGKKD